ncbi:MAG: hypothetical protein LBS46_07310 [Dysgonamonadaceae bacterium]|jgi:hypothetical protein|nr:hypothetical protein [Dysgonamonadaceae bacterium]
MNKMIYVSPTVSVCRVKVEKGIADNLISTKGNKVSMKDWEDGGELGLENEDGNIYLDE